VGHYCIGGNTNVEKAYDLFLRKYKAKYPKLMDCLQKDRDKMLTFPAKHWAHIRTSNPIESVFAKVQLRTTRTKNCRSRVTTLAMAFKLMNAAQKRWHRLRGYQLLPVLIAGVQFKDFIIFTNPIRPI
jgi:putative transposase